MRNDELFNPGSPSDHAKGLVNRYVMSGLTNKHGSYSSNALLARQHAVYLRWLAAVRASAKGFDCGFYEWRCRDCDSAFVFKPGDLVKYDGHYCVVTRRIPNGVGWVNSWRIRNEMPTVETWPVALNTVELKDPNGRIYVVNALDGNIGPADIPPEVFALACGKAKDCPMMREGTE